MKVKGRSCRPATRSAGQRPWAGRPGNPGLPAPKAAWSLEGARAGAAVPGSAPAPGTHPAQGSPPRRSPAASPCAQCRASGLHGPPGPPAQPPVMEASRHVGAAVLPRLLGTLGAKDPTARPGTATHSPAQPSAQGTWCSAQQSSATRRGARALSCVWHRALGWSAPASAPLAAPAPLASSCTTPAACPSVSAPASCMGSSMHQEQ